MKKSFRCSGLLATGALCASVSASHAHDLWVNAASAHDSEADATTVVTSIGWGHMPLPIAEFINAEQLETYAIVAPDGSVMGLPFEATANDDANMIPGAGAPAGLVEMQGGDAFARRLTFDEEAQPGAWRAHAGVAARVYSTWVDAEGQTVSGSQFEDEIEGATEVVSSAVTVRSSDSFWAIGEWQTPMPADVPLQMIPQSDLSAVAAGDEIVVAIYRDGERISAPEGLEFAAFSETGEASGAADENGDLRIALPEPGTWIVRSKHLEDVAQAGPDYAEFDGRIDAITFTATTAIDVLAGPGM